MHSAVPPYGLPDALSEAHVTDKVYSLLSIFDIHILLIYSKGVVSILK